MRLTVQATISAVLFGSSLLAVAATPAAPPFAEVIETIKEKLPGISEAELNDAAVNGLLARIGPRVVLVAEEKSDAGAQALVTQTNIFEGVVAYIRIGQVQSGINTEVQKQLAGMSGSKSVKGVVLDLRYAGGTDYEGAARLVEGFLQQEKPILDWGAGIYRSKKNDGLRSPLVVLVNGKTEGAAEAAAAAIRDTGAGLILGNTTAGKAWRYLDFPMKNGQKLRIAQGSVLLGSGAPVPENGVKPDIAISLKDDEELAYFADPFRILPSSEQAGRSGTNQVRRAEMNEAELVRSRRSSGEPETSRRAPLVEARQLRDPVLARAVDLLKGLALVLQTRS